MCILDRLSTTSPDRREGLMTREQFINHHVGEAYREARRAREPFGAFSYDAETAASAFPEYARALAEAWAFLESRGYLVREPGHGRKVFVGREGEERHAVYRAAPASIEPPAPAERTSSATSPEPAEVGRASEYGHPTAFISHHPQARA